MKFPIGNLFNFSRKPKKSRDDELAKEYLPEIDELAVDLIKDGERILKVFDEQSALLLRVAVVRKELEAGLLKVREIRREYERTHTAGKENR